MLAEGALVVLNRSGVEANFGGALRLIGRMFGGAELGVGVVKGCLFDRSLFEGG